MIIITVKIQIGRRVPKNWMKRTISKAAGLLSFQENIWIIINSSIGIAKKKANADGRVSFVVTKTMESEDLHYNLEWLNITIVGSEEAERDEIKDMENFYMPLKKIMKKDLPKDENLAKHFKTKMINLETLQHAYKKGYGAMEDQSMANKILEMGILTNFELINDYENREVHIR